VEEGALMARRRDSGFAGHDHGNYGAPGRPRRPDGHLGEEYLPTSPRTGRAVAQSTAEREHAEMYGAIDSGGLWDPEEPTASHTRRPAVTQPRYDEAEMAAFVRRYGSDLTGHQWLVYTRFWVERRSYRYIAREISTSVKNVTNTIATLRRRATGITGPLRHTGQMACPRCQAKSEVTRVKHAGSATLRDRLCPKCAHRFRTQETPEETPEEPGDA
jgi:hypothetical protein